MYSDTVEETNPLKRLDIINLKSVTRRWKNRNKFLCAKPCVKDHKPYHPHAKDNNLY